MCTVTFFPAPSGFILTHNRDEAPSRSPQHISRERTGADTLLFPRDTKAGGAWIATAKSGKTACLLNGAFIKHQHNPPYRRSRGLMLLDFFEWEQANIFFQQYDLDGIEPFTFLLFEKEAITELRWDGAQRHLKNLPPDRPHFWCSATLYPPEMQSKREQVFRSWLDSQSPIPNPQSPIPNPQSLITLHRSGSVGDPENDFVMNRSGRVRTVSITQVVSQKEIFQMRYFDLLEGHRDVRRMTARKR
jgi:hypothetical protein